MRRLPGLLTVLAVLAAAAAIAAPLVLAGARPEDTKMSEPALVNPAADSSYRTATFALG
jgi:hypothetical protein